MQKKKAKRLHLWREKAGSTHSAIIRSFIQLIPAEHLLFEAVGTEQQTTGKTAVLVELTCSCGRQTPKERTSDMWRILVCDKCHKNTREGAREVVL